ncbi:hypothetical protein [Amycolatopsis sp. NPDC098790]|uniref:hypothetical protein n=1 Tax=Amycolatopsis sp. NPDC098790 TaxID=3363939 RepID=UPI00380A8082
MTGDLDTTHAVRLVRHQLEQAQQDGRRRPSQRALVDATGLTPEAVDAAFNALEIDWRDTSVRKPSADALTRLIIDEPRRR